MIIETGKYIGMYYLETQIAYIHTVLNMPKCRSLSHPFFPVFGQNPEIYTDSVLMQQNMDQRKAHVLIIIHKQWSVLDVLTFFSFIFYIIFDM